MDIHEKFMLRAIELAELGRGRVSPNPMVGCVIVYDGNIIGEGFHEYFGGPHAEPNAISTVMDPELIKSSTAYVSLEPCAHWGKTPPCADLLAKVGIRKVVIGTVDSNPLVGGKGIQILQKAGIEVLTGVLEEKVRTQNIRFFTFIEKKRPYIILKWAQSSDGFIARENYDSKWISNSYSRQLVHKWRSEEDAIMVGTLTAQYDNPRLNVRDWSGKDPIRVVIDRNLKLNPGLYLFDGTQPTLCYNQTIEESSYQLEKIRLKEGFDLEDIIQNLYSRKIQSVIVEGGAQLLKKFIEKELWDEARVFTGNVAFGKGIPSPVLPGKVVKQYDVQGDLLSFWQFKS
ncbi:bifunctional diaminohydroxyphosphoribosylaminopyrimidine deaminase/5-amino-6-(5-phosphoribosylamino)uracil reductase RibD [Cecembia rubra]|uniref:bifunctional diaminohydroxyphosphoribosylaminopyrimidine deaminase/5-amino-6-(5-phosphoribosylamino)uracil reductase RibD n=1 Tax=Cecembia rubra TaxID=1485585 RepID=UPI00271550E1|nr:bifunctional diaminohydroxyphosphoribosylaminopyrimidine deaminase/5-amino-6-(5-phosphoribosylamino)uracil reductase RibD [Cecembia rubra]